MKTATIKGEDIMTDYQFRSIIKMVLAIARKTNDTNAIIQELENLLPADERSEATDNKERDAH
jgi:mannitol/fructose-specific phosphotransferase system IIA component